MHNIADEKQTNYIDLFSHFINSEGSMDEKGTTSFGNEIKGNYSPINGVVSAAVKYMSKRL